MQLNSFTFESSSASTMKLEDDGSSWNSSANSPQGDSETLPASGQHQANHTSSSSMLLSMMQSMGPFLVFGPQLAALATLSTPRPQQQQRGTDFSIDSILNEGGNRGSRSHNSSARHLLQNSWSTPYSLPSAESYSIANYFDTPSAWLGSSQNSRQSTPSESGDERKLDIAVCRSPDTKCSPSKSPGSCSSSTTTTTTTSTTKRKALNRGPRIPFTSTQVAELEAKFAVTQYLSSMEVNSLAKRLNLTDNRIRIWFQNRRAREKREHRTPLVASASCKVNSSVVESNEPGLDEQTATTTLLCQNDFKSLEEEEQEQE